MESTSILRQNFTAATLAEALAVPRLQAPMVFVHGLFGFDRLQLGGWTLLNYFANIPDHLAAAGNRVLVARLSPTAGVADRAAQLKEFLDRETPRAPVHILAHSMGGLDARYLIARLGMADRVLTLTTIGTPHHGSAFADWCLRRFERLVTPLLDLLGIPYQAIQDLSRDACRRFNERVPDALGVRYFAVAGRHEGDWTRPEWYLPHRVVLREEGPNDGVVSLASATYGESTEVWEGDHISLINWLSPVAQAAGRGCDRVPQYVGLLRRLAEAGF